MKHLNVDSKVVINVLKAHQGTRLGVTSLGIPAKINVTHFLLYPVFLK